MLKMILAVGLNDELGEGDKLLTHIPEDLKYFKQQTTGCPVIMGSLTLKSLPFKDGLPNRKNYVLSRCLASDTENVTYLRNLIEIADHGLCEYEGDVWVIGGACIYEQLKGLVEEVHLTRIEKEFPNADVHFNTKWLEDKDIFEKVSETNLTEGVNVLVYKRIKQ